MSQCESEGLKHLGPYIVHHAVSDEAGVYLGPTIVQIIVDGNHKKPDALVGLGKDDAIAIAKHILTRYDEDVYRKGRSAGLGLDPNKRESIHG